MQGSGRTIRCTKGVYWAQQGVGACDDMPGTNVFRLPDGTPVTNTALITNQLAKSHFADDTLIEQGGGPSLQFISPKF